MTSVTAKAFVDDFAGWLERMEYRQIEDFSPDLVAVFGGDHIYRMDISQMVDFHVNKNSIATVAAIPVPIEDAKQK